MELRFTIKNQIMTCVNPTKLVSDSMNFVTTYFSFDSEWDDLYKVVTFTNKNTEVRKSVLLGLHDERCYIPWEVLASNGVLSIYVNGSKTINQIEIVATTAMTHNLRIIKSDQVEPGEGTQQPTPDIYTQIINRLNHVEGSIPSSSDIDLMIKEYIKNNSVISDEEINKRMEKYFEDHPIAGIGELNANKVKFSLDGYQLQNVDEALQVLFDKTFYIDPKILSFNMSPSTTIYELGTTINNLSFNWTLNKSVPTISVTNAIINDTKTGAICNTPFSSSKTFTLTVSDGTNSVSLSKTIDFYNKKYWGCAIEPTEYNNDFILSLLNNQLTNSKNGNINFNANDDQYCYFAIPSTFGTPSFTINGFTGGFELITSILFTNKSNYSTNYNIYKSTRMGLGAFTATIS